MLYKLNKALHFVELSGFTYRVFTQPWSTDSINNFIFLR